jgi:Flp pilus assembly pilin Flp
VRLRRMLGDAGASAVEYALIIAAVAVVLIPLAFAIQSLLGQILDDSCASTGKQNGLTDTQIAAQC